eukprot:1158274-Pelagomonas_calceolata.AAC.24
MLHAFAAGKRELLETILVSSTGANTDFAHYRLLSGSHSCCHLLKSTGSSRKLFYTSIRCDCHPTPPLLHRCAQIWTDVYKCYISSCSARCAQHDMAGMIEMMHLNGAGKVCGMM